ncbi:MAG: hypothetical protein AAB522_02375 [Patescibacteria group bacterium]
MFYKEGKLMRIPDLVFKNMGEKPLILRSLSIVKEKLETGSRIKNSGTTIIALHYKDGVLMAGDRRTTFGDVHTDEAIKIEEVQNDTIIGCAGMVSFIQDLKETLLHVITRLENVVETPIYIDGQAAILKSILKANFDFYGWIYAVPILAGYHPKKKQSFVFEFDEAGAMYKKIDYATTGSGGQLAWGVLKDRWKLGLKEKEALELAMRALMLASFDNYSSHPFVSPSTIMVVSKKYGVLSMKEEKSLNMAYSIFREYLERHGKSKELKIFHKGDE